MNKLANCSFWLYKAKMNSKGICPIYMRISIGADKTEVATGIFIKPSQWNSSKADFKGNDNEILSHRKEADRLKQPFYGVYNDLLNAGVDFTSNTIKNRMTGKGKQECRTLMETISVYNQNVEKLQGKQYSTSTLKKYQAMERIVPQFLKEIYNLKDFPLSEL